MYLRLHGGEELYVSGYSEAALDNDAKVHTPFDAQKLIGKLA